jgi:hypothetical protein
MITYINKILVILLILASSNAVARQPDKNTHLIIKNMTDKILKVNIILQNQNKEFYKSYDVVKPYSANSKEIGIVMIAFSPLTIEEGKNENFNGTPTYLVIKDEMNNIIKKMSENEVKKKSSMVCKGDGYDYSEVKGEIFCTKKSSNIIHYIYELQITEDDLK